MKFIINDQMVLLRAPEGPLAPYVASFSKWAIGQGYARCSLRQRVRIAASFSRWLAEKSVRLRRVSSRHSAQYLHIAHDGSGFVEVTPPHLDSSSIFCVIRARPRPRRYAGDD